MKFIAALFALMAVTSVAAAPAGPKQVAGGAKKGVLGLGAAAKAAAAKKAAGGKGSKAAGGAAAAAAALAAAKAAKAAAAAGSANSTAIASNSTVSASDNSTAAASDNSTAAASDNSTATATSTAGSATRTRPCDQGDQALAAGLNAAVVIGIGQQASVVTLQGASAAADFTAGVTRLQQFVDTMSLQMQMAAAIADDGSFAQTQLKLLASSQTAQAALVKGLVDAKTSAADLTTLTASFLDSTNNAQDGAEQALIDCFLPVNAVSG